MEESKNKGGNPAWTKGVSGNPQGKAKGTQDRIRRETREKFLGLIQNNMDNMQEWLDLMSIEDPEKAANFVVKLLPYFIPKLTEDVSEHPQSPIFILPAGVDVNAINQAARKINDEDEENEDE